MRLRLAFPVFLAALALCPSAVASEVRHDEVFAPKGGLSHSEFSYLADAGERNTLTVTREAGDYVFRDPGAVIRPGRCTAVNPHEVRCRVPAILDGVRVAAGDSDDSVTLGDLMTRLIVDAGAGDDRVDASAAGSPALPAIDGGSGDDELLGTAAGDFLTGGDGADVLRGGAGRDSLEGGTGSDTLDGGADADGVTYRGSSPVRVDLSDPAPDGAAGENDRLTALENVTVIGSGGDVLIGDDGPNVLVAGGGANRVEGRGGHDRINVGDRRDRVSGGAGDDVIDANGRFFSRRTQPISCGAGADLVRAPGTTDLLERDCERVEYLYFLLSARPLALDTRRGIAGFRWSVECPSGYRCSALLRLRSGSTLLGQAYLRTRDGSQRFHVRLTRAGRAFARRGSLSRVHVSVRRDRRRTSGGRVGRGETRTYGIRGLAP